MEDVNVYSPIEDKDIRKNLNGSPIWKQAFHQDELADAMKQFSTMFHYVIKFDGLKPVQVSNISKMAK